MDGANGGDFSPRLGRFHMGLGSMGTAWHGEQSQAAVKSPAGSNIQCGGVLASADPLEDPKGTGTGLWQACGTPECPTPSALCTPLPPGSQGLACASRSTSRHLVSVKKARRSRKPRMQLGVRNPALCWCGTSHPRPPHPASHAARFSSNKWMSERLRAPGPGLTWGPQPPGAPGHLCPSNPPSAPTAKTGGWGRNPELGR